MQTALPDAFRTLCRGVLHAIGMFDPAEMTNSEKAADPVEYRTWFHFGETCMAALLAGNIAVPAGVWFATRTELPLAFIGASVLFLPLFVFLPQLIRYAMKVDTDAVLDAFGKNEHVKKVFWAFSQSPKVSPMVNRAIFGSSALFFCKAAISRGR